MGGGGAKCVHLYVFAAPLLLLLLTSCYPRMAPLAADIYLYKFEDVEVGFITKHLMTGPSLNKLKLLFCFS